MGSSLMGEMVYHTLLENNPPRTINKALFLDKATLLFQISIVLWTSLF